MATDSSSRDNSSRGSSIPVIFGVIGGILLLLIIALAAAIIYFKYTQRKRSKLVAHFTTKVIIDIYDIYIDQKVDEHQSAYLEVIDIIYDSAEAEQKGCEVCKNVSS